MAVFRDLSRTGVSLVAAQSWQISQQTRQKAELGRFSVTPRLLEVYVMTEAIPVAAGEDPANKMTELITEMARALVDSPGSVSVQAFQDGDGTVLRLRVAASDVGKVIGKQGRTARSIRTILGAASMKLKHRFSLDIVEENEAPKV
jgi:predicted RNA-binding protein YlqC (UPF0109 family)